ncbi:glyoxylate/hydroxypyruvate reductase HPR3-like [Phoenix dactylifera]|uniref:Glyoxylate/hydroxypyruvate reductase HPR3-like n=1 Tax=Phoenix dactylifera TaxID=42345 RepID=A0A8B7BR16_PHODC|nr:glyoxylate/hydroxypyruvate reductase HPR3-like [Phoenix dactylifera]
MSAENHSEETPAEEQELPLVLVLRPIFPHFHDALATKFRFLKPWESPLPRDEFLAAHAGAVQALLCPGPTPVDAQLLAYLPRLELVVASSAGVNHIDVAACRRRGIAITNAGNAFTDDVADYAVALLIDVLRKISASDRYVRRGLWPIKGDYPLGRKLGGKRVGIIGLGSIGSAVARRLDAIGCTILYHSRTKKPSVSHEFFSNVTDLAAESEVLIITCALTAETHHIVDKEVMLALGKDGIIINIGRGALVDEKELVRCLMEGEIGGAGLDVFENEPAVPQELFHMDNVVLSHHQAVFTPESFHGLLKVVMGNLEAFFSNRPLLTPISE